jgi:type IV secretory pathway VirB10-like protein
MKIPSALLAGIALTTAVAASAQWQWIDKEGRKVFSDLPPPADAAPRQIVKQPNTKEQSAPPPPAQSDATRTVLTPPRPPGKDSQLEERKRQADAAAAARTRQEQEHRAQARADNCDRARQAKKGFDSGARVARTNAQGEREFLDDDARSAEIRRLQGIIDASCQ